MADDKKDKELIERATLAGTFKLTPAVEKFLTANPEIREKVFGDLERRKLEIDTQMEEVKRLQTVENARLRNANLAFKTLTEALNQIPLQIFDAESRRDQAAVQQLQERQRRLQERLVEAERAVLPDENLINQITSMQNHAIRLMRGEDIADSMDLENTVQVGETRISKDQFDLLRSDPILLQQTLDQLREEAEGGNTESLTNITDLVDMLGEDFVSQQLDRSAQELLPG